MEEDNDDLDEDEDAENLSIKNQKNMLMMKMLC